jgi:hypothetical protein
MEEPTTNGDPFNMGKYTCKHVKWLYISI